MNILFNKSNFVLAASLLITTAALAQQGVGTDTPEKSSVLELKSTKRGLLVPRIALTKTNVEAPVHLPANSLLVYNTNTTTGANKVEPGYYYWSQDDSSWMRIINQKDIDTAISNIGDTKVTSAELSGTTLKIKQNGVVTDVSVDLASLVKTYTGDNTSIKIDGTTVKRAALTGDVEAAEGSSTTKVTKIQGQAISATAPTTDGQVLKWNGSEWAPAADADTQSKETVSSGDISIIDVTASGGPLNKDYAVKIKGAGASETKVLQSVNGTVKWGDAPSTASMNTISGTAKVLQNIAVSDWGQPGDVFAIVQTSTNAIHLPSAKTFEGRIISVTNAGTTTANYAPGNDSPYNASTLDGGHGHLLMAIKTGTVSNPVYKWYVIGGGY